jgi:hypothetical protein
MGLVIRLLVLATLVLGAAGCSPLARGRTLPPSIRSVYVPMIINRTAEPGIDEDLTVAIQEEFLADGRLDVVRERQADATVTVIVKEWGRTSRYFDDDDYPVGQSYDVEAEVEVIENIPGHPSIGGRRGVRTVVFYNADPRTTTFDPEPRRKESAYRTLARQIVNEVLTGDYAEVSVTGEEIPTQNTVIRPAL